MKGLAKRFSESVTGCMAILLLAAVLGTAFPVFAAGTAEDPAAAEPPAAEPPSYTALVLDETAAAEIKEDSESAWFSFTPEISGTYRFVSEGTADTFAEAFEDPAGERIAMSDDAKAGESDADTNFSLELPLIKDTPYYFRTAMTDGTEGSFNVKISYVGKALEKVTVLKIIHIKYKVLRI